MDVRQPLQNYFTVRDIAEALVGFMSERYIYTCVENGKLPVLHGTHLVKAEDAVAFVLKCRQKEGVM